MVTASLRGVEGRRSERQRRGLIALVGAMLLLLLPFAQPARAAAGSYDAADYFAFADRIVRQLDATWSPSRGYYTSKAPAVDSRYNAALLTVHAAAAAYGHVGPSRNDERARVLARRLTRSPPFFDGVSPSW